MKILFITLLLSASIYAQNKGMKCQSSCQVRYDDCLVNNDNTVDLKLNDYSFSQDEDQKSTCLNKLKDKCTKLGQEFNYQYRCDYASGMLSKQVKYTKLSFGFNL